MRLEINVFSNINKNLTIDFFINNKKYINMLEKSRRNVNQL
jgi:hypothetical protein